MQSYPNPANEAAVESHRKAGEAMAAEYRGMTNEELIKALKMPGVRLAYPVHLVIVERIREFEKLKKAAENYEVQTHWVCPCGRINATALDHCAKCHKIAEGLPATFWQMVESMK